MIQLIHYHIYICVCVINQYAYEYIYIYDIKIYISHICIYTSSTAQGGGGSFKNWKPIGRVGCCDSRMAEQIH